MGELQDLERMMSSLEVAETTGKRHKHVMEAIRKMENGWLKAGGTSFRLTTYKDAQGKDRPCYQLTKEECLFVSTKFNDEARARLVMRWKAIETGEVKPMVEIAKEQHQEQKPKTPAEMLLMQAQLMVDQERRIAAIESKIEKIEQEREENGRLLLAAKLSEETVIPKITPRDQIRQLVNRYAAAANIAQQDVWHKIYDQLYYLYHISIRQYKKDKRETYLDVAERNNFLDKIYNIISNLIRERGVANNNVA